MKRIHCFDFDGTLTDTDSLLHFIAYARGRATLIYTLLLYSPLLILMKLHVISNHKVKQTIFSHIFKGTTATDFNRICEHFARTFQPHLRPCGLSAIDKALADGDTVIIVSASVDQWVRPCVNRAGIILCGTRLEEKDGVLTGRFLGLNCYGQEKVDRITALLDKSRSDYYIIAYGDSRGDKEMLAFADEPHYKPFKG